jgi:hypothetical protein
MKKIYILSLLITVGTISNHIFAQTATIDNFTIEGVNLLFNGVKTKLTQSDKISIFKQLEFRLSKNKKQFITEYCDGEYAFNATVYPTDMNKDGDEEIFIGYGDNMCISGDNYHSTALFIKNADGLYMENFKFPGHVKILHTSSKGYFDLLISGPGFEFPIWRFINNQYFLDGQVSDNDLDKLKRTDLSSFSIEYTNTLSNNHGTQPDNSKSKLKLGDFYAGGFIFYIDKTGEHGLVCASKDQGIAKWGCNNIEMAGTSTDNGFGNLNTLKIYFKCNEIGTAARICYDLVLNEFDDWYLPSKDELNLIYSNLHLNGIGDFSSNFYWSSSECDSSFSWDQDFSSGSQFKNIKYITISVRAVRSF